MVWKNLIQTKKEFGEKAELLSRKGIYPYDYMNGINKFSEEKLPQKEEFFSKLNDCNISDEDFDHAQRIWKEFGMKNLGEYHDLYLKSDVLLLADVFEEFRKCLHGKLFPGSGLVLYLPRIIMGCALENIQG